MRAVDLRGHCSRIGQRVAQAVLRTVAWSSTLPCLETFLLNFSAVLRVECRGSPSSSGAEDGGAALELSVTKAAASSRDLYERKYVFFMFIFVPIFKSKIDLKEFSVARKDDQR